MPIAMQQSAHALNCSTPTESTYVDGSDTYTVKTFTDVAANCDWTVPSGVTSIETVIVGGGGGAGFGNCGGGGGGGRLLVSNAPINVVAGTALSLTVGAGGQGGWLGAHPNWSPGTSGSASSITIAGTTYSASGGGGGGGMTTAGLSGGSGGGGTSCPTSAGGAADASTVSGFTTYGNAGSTGGPNTYEGGGGGGAGTAGSIRHGGNGRSVWGVTLAGGGGGWTNGVGGTGGGGNAGSGYDTLANSGNPGTDGLGGGGGGGNNGGSGRVMIRYLVPAAIEKVTIDPANTSSYPGTGSTVTDLVSGITGTMSNVGFETSTCGVFNFAGSGRIDFPRTNFGNQFTLSVWLKPTTNSVDIQTIFANAGNGFGSNGFKAFWGYNGITKMVLENGNGGAGAQGKSSNSDVVPGEWQHLVYAFNKDTNQITMYRNGTSIAVQAVNVGMRSDANTDQNWWLGAMSGTSYAMNALIGVVRVYSSVLTGSQVTTDMNLNSARYSATPNCPASPPTNSSSPAVSGSTQFGSVLTAAGGTWTGSPSLTYQWQRAATSSGSFSDISGANTNTYTLVGADSGKYLRVSVTATNGAGSTAALSSPTSAITALVPASPTLTSATGGDRRITLAFTPGSDGGSPITDFQYSLNGETFTAMSSTTSPFTLMSLLGRAVYTIRIRAQNLVGFSEPTTGLSATTTNAVLDASEAAAAEAARLAAIAESARLAAEAEAARLAAIAEAARLAAEAQAAREAQAAAAVVRLAAEKAAAEAKAKADEDARIKAEADAKAEAEKKAKLEAEAKLKAEADARAKLKAAAEAKAKLEAENKAKEKAKEEAEAKAEADAKAKAEEAKVKAEEAKVKAEEVKAAQNDAPAPAPAEIVTATEAIAELKGSGDVASAPIETVEVKGRFIDSALSAGGNKAALKFSGLKVGTKIKITISRNVDK